MSLINVLSEKLKETNSSVKLDRFREITMRLLTWGVIVRDEDRTEESFYDDARRVESLLVEYFVLAGMVLHHDRNSQFFRLYGPGAVVDGLPKNPISHVPSFKARVSVDFVAAAIALRFLYQNKLDQGLIDGQGEVLINFEDLAITLLTQLKRQMPESNSEKMGLLADLKRHRLLRYSSGFSIADEDAYLAIRPTILGIVSNEALAAALDADGVIEEVVQVEETAE